MEEATTIRRRAMKEPELMFDIQDFFALLAAIFKKETEKDTSIKF